MILQHAREAYKVDVEISDDDFFPVASRIRERLLGERVLDLVLELEHLHRSVDRFSRQEPSRAPAALGVETTSLDGGRLLIGGRPVMEPHQHEVMNALAAAVATPGGDILEIGFGLGVAATAIQRIGVRTHTIVESNPEVIERFFVPWRARFPEADIRIIGSKWQDAELGRYTGVLADPHFPADETEVAQGVPEYARGLLERTSRHLVDGGALTYFGGHTDSISRFEQRFLLRYFRRLELTLLEDLVLPADSELLPCRDYVVIRAVK